MLVLGVGGKAGQPFARGQEILHEFTHEVAGALAMIHQADALADEV